MVRRVNCSRCVPVALPVKGSLGNYGNLLSISMEQHMHTARNVWMHEAELTLRWGLHTHLCGPVNCHLMWVRIQFIHIQFHSGIFERNAQPIRYCSVRTRAFMAFSWRP